MKRALLLAGIALGATSARSASAQSNPSFFPPRYAVCREVERVVPAPPPPTPTRDGFVPLRVGPPPPLRTMEPLVVIDVAVTEPVPARTAPAPRPPEPAEVRVADALDYRCIGFPRGKAGILRVLEAPPGARFARQSRAHDYRLLHARAAATAGYPEAVAALDRLLRRPVPSGRDLEVFEALDAKLHAARALGDLGVGGAAARFAEHLASRENDPYSIVWLASLPALAHLDPRVAERYAADVVGRVVAGRGPPAPDAASDGTLLRGVLPLLVTPDAGRAALLARLPQAGDCNVLAARVRLGDRALRAELRAELATDLRTQRGAACYGEVMPDVFPGEEPDEVDTLLFRHRMDALLALVRRGRAAPRSDARWAAALGTVRRALLARSSEPDIAGGTSDNRYQPQKRAKHLVLLAALGEPGAARDLTALVRDAKDHGVAPWVAAEWALAMDLPGAADLAAERLRLAIAGRTDRYDTDLDPVRGFLDVNDHVRLIDALAERGDPRFALGLLDRERPGREAAAFQLARRKPAAACDLVAGAADDATEEAVQDGFWALSLLGQGCREAAWSLAKSPQRPPHVRGMALELGAMLRDPRVSSLLGPRGSGDDIAPARARARIIFHASP